MKIEYLELEVENVRANAKDEIVAFDVIKPFQDEVDRLQEENDKLGRKYEQLNEINKLQDLEIEDLNNELKKAGVGVGSSNKELEDEVIELKSKLSATKKELAKMVETADATTGAGCDLLEELEDTKKQLEDTKKKVEVQAERVKKFKDANASLREEMLTRDDEIIALKDQTNIHTNQLEEQSLSLSQLQEFTKKVKGLQEQIDSKDNEIAQLKENTDFSEEKIQVLEEKLRAAQFEMGKKLNESIDADNKVSNLEVEKRTLELAVVATENRVSKLESEMSNIVSKSKEETGILQGTIANLKKGKESLEEAVEEIEGELVNLKAKVKGGMFKLESEEDYEEALSKVVEGIDMLAILTRRSNELSQEYTELVQVYNEEGNRTNENVEILLDHVINLGIVELMVFELKKHEIYPRGGGLGKYKIRQLKRGIAAEVLEQYSESFHDV